MILSVMCQSLLHGKVRFACAVAGVAAAVGAIVFVFSLASTNAGQAPARARRLLSEVPVQASAPSAFFALDYRPGGHVMQGPPLRVVAVEDDACAPTSGVTITRALFAQRHLPVPPVGSELTLVGEHGTYKVRIGRILPWDRPVRGYPNLFISRRESESLSGEAWRPLPAFSVEDLAPRLMGDEERRMDFARPLMLVAALLTAFAMLVNALLLSVEANRRPLATLRMIGLTRFGAGMFVLAESMLATVVGTGLGGLGAVGTLALWVALDPHAFPMGLFLSGRAGMWVAALAPVVAGGAALFALRPALSVRPLDACGERPRRQRRGMAIAFACGFGAFVAVEVWGASLMRAFVPSEEWPDAIISLLPEGTSSFDVEKLRTLPGVRRISELYPLQLDFDPAEPLASPRSDRARPPADDRRRGGSNGEARRPQNRNALFLAAEWLPKFRFLEGSWEEATNAVFSSDACVITEMMSRARDLHRGGRVRVALGGRGPRTVVELPIAGVVDLNWHMVTSRGLLRGLRGAPGMTDGPVFVSFDTIESLDARPAFMTKMTHLCVDYDPDFLKAKGVFAAGREVERSVARALGFSTDDAATAAATVRLHARDEIADGTLAHGSSVIGQTARVPFIFLGILVFGFVAMLVADADAAKREFAILHAVGATRFQLAVRLVRGAVRTAFVGIGIGFPVGALTGWLFTFGTGNWPGIPHYFEIPVAVIAEGTVGALAFVLLVTVPTALTLVRRPAT